MGSRAIALLLQPVDALHESLPAARVSLVRLSRLHTELILCRRPRCPPSLPWWRLPLSPNATSVLVKN